ncbi:hypothetical protein GCM10022392_02610 [Mucilaginibacter panaciglaebae]|uniref:Uncharacterized protein n=1 Tax=Mucilaginibacter panaciglaebae TaxID=502331 RepID=A0ABP7WBX1_9SPHI
MVKSSKPIDVTTSVYCPGLSLFNIKNPSDPLEVPKDELLRKTLACGMAVFEALVTTLPVIEAVCANTAAGSKKQNNSNRKNRIGNFVRLKLRNKAIADKLY